jgi:hypothetical protein
MISSDTWFGPGRRYVDGDSAAHAVTHQAAPAKSKRVDESDDRSRVILEAIGEVGRLVAIPVAEEVDQQRTATSQRRLDGRRHQLAGRGTLPAVQPKQRGILAGNLDVAKKCPSGR